MEALKISFDNGNGSDHLQSLLSKQQLSCLDPLKTAKKCFKNLEISNFKSLCLKTNSVDFSQVV